MGRREDRWVLKVVMGVEDRTRLEALAKEWEVTLSAAVRRLLLEEAGRSLRRGSGTQITPA